MHLFEIPIIVHDDKEIQGKEVLILAKSSGCTERRQETLSISMEGGNKFFVLFLLSPFYSPGVLVQRQNNIYVVRKCAPIRTIGFLLLIFIHRF